MKDLLERLSPKVKQMLDSERVDYPASIEKIEDALRGVYIVADVKYGILCDIQLFLGYPSEFEPREWFLKI